MKKKQKNKFLSRSKLKKVKIYYDKYVDIHIIKYFSIPITKTDEKRYYFETYLYPVFTKLIRGIVTSSGIDIPGQTQEDLESECMEKLYSILPKFDPSFGSKSFSFFTRSLINFLKGLQKKHNRVYSLDAMIEAGDNELDWLYTPDLHLRQKVTNKDFYGKFLEDFYKENKVSDVNLNTLRYKTKLTQKENDKLYFGVVLKTLYTLYKDKVEGNYKSLSQLIFVISSLTGIHKSIVEKILSNIILKLNKMVSLSEK